MSKDDLAKRQKMLQEEGQEVLNNLQLIPFLSKFGTPSIVGSFTLGLMTWPDIDIELRQKIDENAYWQTVQYIFKQPSLKGTFIKDYRGSTNPSRPNGLYIGVQYSGKEPSPWKIDIWFLDTLNTREVDITEWVKSNLKFEHRLPILEIKNAIYMNPKYRKSIFSVDVYKAVIEREVRDVEGFKKYLSETGRELA